MDLEVTLDSRNVIASVVAMLTILILDFVAGMIALAMIMASLL